MDHELTFYEKMDIVNEILRDFHMDFLKLTTSQLNEFLNVNGFDITGISRHEARNEVAVIFLRLYRAKAKAKDGTFTIPVMDLYIASQLKQIMKPVYLYTLEYLTNAGPEVISRFATIMGIPIDGITRERVIRILDFMEILIPMDAGDLIDNLTKMTIYYEIIEDVGATIDEFTAIRLYDENLAYLNRKENDVEYSLAIKEAEIIEAEFLDLPGDPEKYAGKTFLTLKLAVSYDTLGRIYEQFGDDELDFKTTDENMIRAFGNTKISIPYSFIENVYIERGEHIGTAGEFRFSHIESEDIRVPVYIHIKN